MNLRKFISGVSALTIAASAFASMAVTASASVETTTTYDFSTTYPTAPTTSRWSVNTSAADPTDETNTAALYSAASNSGNGSGAYLYYDLSSLIPADVISYTVSYKAYFPYNTNVRWSLGLADLTNFTFARYGYDATSAMIGSAGHFTDSFIRATSGGNRSFVSDWQNAPRWVTVTDTVNVQAGTWTASIAGDATYNTNGTLAAGAAYDKLLIYGYALVGTSALDSIYLDDITITTTAPDPGAATAVAVNYTLNGSTIATDTKDISAEGLLSGADYSFNAPAYVAKDGSVYSTGLSGNKVSTKKTVSLVEGTTTVEIPVTLAAQTGAFFETEDVISGGTEQSSDYASMGKGVRRLDQKQMTVTVPADGIYTVTAGFVSSRSNSTTDTVSAYKDAYSAEATPLFSFSLTQTEAYYGNERSQADVELNAGDKLVFYTGSWNTGLDYVLLVKTADLPTHTDAEYDTTLTEVYNSTEGDNVWAKAYTFTVTPNDDTVTAVKVTDNAGKFVEKTDLSLTGTGAIVFGILAAAKTENGLDGITFTPSITIAE